MFCTALKIVPRTCRDEMTGSINMTFLLLIIGIFMSSALADTQETVVDTPSGKIKGINLAGQFGNVVQFRNIPFAKAPVGDLRFKKPVAKEPWTDTYDATSFGPSCMQNLDMIPAFKNMLENDEFSEDCLSLNVYVPNEVNANNKKSVMVWIHGGSFLMGQGHAYNCSILSVVGDVIVVTINYRLGIFGFLSTEDSVSPGNYGLWDQIMAFKWVQRNIAAFGGNPDSVTIFGESAGSYSVSAQMMIPENRGLFQRVIAQSGVIMFSTPFSPHPLNYAKKIGQSLNCTDSVDSNVNTKQLMTCLQKFDSKTLLNAQDSVNFMAMNPDNFSMEPTVWPSFDGDLFKSNNPLEDLYRESEVRSFYRSLDFLAGTTNAEGLVSVMFAGMFQEKYQFNITDGLPKKVFCDEIAVIAARDFFHDVNGVVGKAICEFYGSDGIEEQGRNFVNFFGDVFFSTSTVGHLNLHTTDNEKATYEYLFSKPSETNLLGPPPTWDSDRSNHGTDMEFLFNVKGFPDFFTNDEDKDKAEFFIRMVKYWSNFAKTGNPNGEGLPVWPRYELDNKAYLELNLDISQGKDLFLERVKFMLDTIPQLVKNEKRRENKSEL